MATNASNQNNNQNHHGDTRSSHSLMPRNRYCQHLQYRLQAFSKLWHIDEDLEAGERLLLFLDKVKSFFLADLTNMHQQICELSEHEADEGIVQNTLTQIGEHQDKLVEMFTTLGEDLYTLSGPGEIQDDPQGEEEQKGCGDPDCDACGPKEQKESEVKDGQEKNVKHEKKGQEDEGEDEKDSVAKDGKTTQADPTSKKNKKGNAVPGANAEDVAADSLLMQDSGNRIKAQRLKHQWTLPFPSPNTSIGELAQSIAQQLGAVKVQSNSQVVQDKKASVQTIKSMQPLPTTSQPIVANAVVEMGPPDHIASDLDSKKWGSRIHSDTEDEKDAGKSQEKKDREIAETIAAIDAVQSGDEDDRSGDEDGSDDDEASCCSKCGEPKVSGSEDEEGDEKEDEYAKIQPALPKEKATIEEIKEDGSSLKSATHV